MPFTCELRATRRRGGRRCATRYRRSSISWKKKANRPFGPCSGPPRYSLRPPLLQSLEAQLNLNLRRAISYLNTITDIDFAPLRILGMMVEYLIIAIGWMPLVFA